MADKKHNAIRRQMTSCTTFGTFLSAAPRTTSNRNDSHRNEGVAVLEQRPGDAFDKQVSVDNS